MTKLDEIAPTEKPRLMDLVEEAGVDVSDWGKLSRGQEKRCEESEVLLRVGVLFVEPHKVVVLNLWHDLMKERKDGTISPALRHAAGFGAERPSPEKERAVQNRTEAIQTAIKEKLPIRVIVLGGRRRNPNSSWEKASLVSKRLLESRCFGLSPSDDGRRRWWNARWNAERGDLLINFRLAKRKRSRPDGTASLVKHSIVTRRFGRRL